METLESTAEQLAGVIYNDNYKCLFTLNQQGLRHIATKDVSLTGLKHEKQTFERILDTLTDKNSKMVIAGELAKLDQVIEQIEKL